MSLQICKSNIHQVGSILAAPCQHSSPYVSTSCSSGVDDAESECGLDQGVDFDWTIRNDGDITLLDAQLEGLMSLARERTWEHQGTQDSIKSYGQ